MLDLILLYFKWLFITFSVTSTLFIVIMAIKDTLSKQSKKVRKYVTPIFYPLLLVGLLSDLLLNYLLIPVFMDLPKYPLELVTGRMTRYKKTETGFRKKFAIFLCSQLNRWDENHC